MRKFIAACFILFFVSASAATTIQSEEVRVDLADSSVEVDMEVKELTSERLSYLTSYPVENVEARIEDQEISCDVMRLQIGSEIGCEAPQKQNFTVHLEFEASGLVEPRQRINMFRYTQNFYRPTNEFQLRVVLPKGAGLLNGENPSVSVISPANAETGSNGRRIFVEWNREPELGETVSFQVAYEKFFSPVNLRQGVALVIVAAVLLIAGRSAYLRVNREDIENVYEDLNEDEIEVVELLRENEGEMLQKEVVEQLDYSKAKVSGVVSGLVEKGILVKQKEGRSNRLSISRGYRG